ncbi:uncharacterized protein KD926_005017 [Aspergillus affinis]|uniref:uncharacterized protein n=1 Tax=Aspergillus affinis TaxID=1070780 RepID=UPI0022FEBF44|nr:uncharacterized protein KD926_005017 [Aspergillus affinis]KAI9034923.1 hypothetical protein KD926_005017 [Aspergillus affinis]
MALPGLQKLHKKPYLAISPTRPEISQEGCTILITGGNSGIGFSIARAFVAPKAKHVIIVARRADSVKAAVSRLVPRPGKDSPTVVEGRELKNNAVHIDTLVLNAASLGKQKFLLEAGCDGAWQDFVTNVRSNIDWAERVYKREGRESGRRKSLVSDSTCVTHMRHYATDRPTYGMTKLAGTDYFQQLALEVNPEDMQITIFHPGIILTEAAARGGVDNSSYDWDDAKPIGPRSGKYPVKTESLQFWRDNQSRFPAITLLARDAPSIPATGAGVERLFNTARNSNENLEDIRIDLISDDEEEEEEEEDTEIVTSKSSNKLVGLGAESNTEEPQLPENRTQLRTSGRKRKEASVNVIKKQPSESRTHSTRMGNEESEAWLGEWMGSRGVRDQIVLATKYSSSYRAYNRSENLANSVGNSTKSLKVSVEASLRKLRTDYIDLLYIHWWDFATSIEEVMTPLHQLVMAGKVLYLGSSDTPAWIVSRANQYAWDHGIRPFSVYQGQWSAAKREFERDIIPMCHAEGMGLCPWGALGSASFKTVAQREEIRASLAGNSGRQANPRAVDVQVSKVLEAVAARYKTEITSVALAYVMHKAPHVHPIIGGRKIEHLLRNIEALGLALSQEDLTEIKQTYGFNLGFPMTYLFQGDDRAAHPSNSTFLNVAATFDYPGLPRPIVPKQQDA